MKKYLALSLSMLLVFVLCAPLCAMAKSETDDANAFVLAYPESTMERYVCAKAVQNNTTFEEEMKKELSEVVPLSIDEKIAYRTQSGRAGRIETNLSVLYPVITTEAKVVVNQVTGWLRFLQLHMRLRLISMDLLQHIPRLVLYMLNCNTINMRQVLDYTARQFHKITSNIMDHISGLALQRPI